MKLILSITTAFLLSVGSWAQTGLVGFANYPDFGLHGTTGGMGGEIVHVTSREDFEKYAGSPIPYIIILDNDLKGHYNYHTSPKQKHDVVTITGDKTIIGGGAGACLDSLGLDVKDAHNVIIRNLKISNADPDAISFRNTHHVWVDHCDLSSSKEGRDENDGLLDFTYGSSYLTVSWCRFHDHDKSSICSSGTRNIKDLGRQRVTYHHNAFINCTQRNPRIGYGLGHIFNDYNDTNTLYGIGFFARARINIENCYFKNVKKPFSQMYAADFGEEDAYWGFFNSRGNIFENSPSDGVGSGYGFDPTRFYLYDFALDQAEYVPVCVSRMGCVDGIESDIIPFPGDGAIGLPLDVRLACGDIEGAESYFFYIGEASDALTPCDPVALSLEPSSLYFWQVKVNGGKYDGKTSGIFRFATADAKPSFPVPFDGVENALLREIDSVTDTCIPLHLRWRPAFDAVGYNVFVSTDSTFSDAGGTTVSNPIFQPTGLRQGLTYFWRADAIHSDGSVTTGDTWRFNSPVSYARVGRNEAEHAVRGALCFPEKEEPGGWIIASNDSCTVGDQGPGYICYEWSGPKEKYRISTAYLDEKSGHSWFGLYINDQLKDEWIANDDNNQMTVRDSDNILLSPGDEIRLEFCTDRNMRTRIDYLDIHPSE